MNPIQRPGVPEEIYSRPDQSRRAREGARVDPVLDQVLEARGRVQALGQRHARVGGVDGGEVALGQGYCVVEQVERVGGVGALAFGCDGELGRCYLVGGEVGDDFAQGVRVVGDWMPFAFVEVGGGFAEDGVASVGLEDPRQRVGFGLLWLRSCFGPARCCCCCCCCCCCAW